MKSSPESAPVLAFIGGGNMASALIGGLIKAGHPASALVVVEPHAPQRELLQQRFAVNAVPEATPRLSNASMVVWAVKPQSFTQAAKPCAAHVGNALQLSVMAGIRSDAIVRATGSARVVRAMPNTPALIGQGIAGLYARPEVSATERALVESVLGPTGLSLWVQQESDLDAVTAVSGSGPAYAFYLIEAMTEAAQRMGLSDQQGRALAIQTVAGAAALAQQSPHSAAELRAQVTSKGGTTHAALTSMEVDGVKAAIVRGILAAQHRAAELGDEFGG